jgi:hypothetical protein
LLPSADVAALGRLLRRLATGPDARPLRRIAEAATAEDSASRPSAQAVADEVAAAVPGAQLPSPGAGIHPRPDPLHDLRSLVGGPRGGRRRRPASAAGTMPPRRAGGLLGTESAAGEASGARLDEGSHPRPPAPPPQRSPRRRGPGRFRPLAAGVAVVTVIGVLLMAPWASRGDPSVSSAAPTTAAVPSSRPSSPSTVATRVSTTPSTVRTDCAVPASVLVADVDADGCLDALHYSDGVLEATGLRWAVGQTGDQVATGDWSCRGTRTVVLLRPATGEVFRFDGWAVGSRESVTATAVAKVAGGQAVRAADVDRDGCHELVVERGDLPPQVVRLPRPQP